MTYDDILEAHLRGMTDAELVALLRQRQRARVITEIARRLEARNSELVHLRSCGQRLQNVLRASTICLN